MEFFSAKDKRASPIRHVSNPVSGNIHAARHHRIGFFNAAVMLLHAFLPDFKSVPEICHVVSSAAMFTGAFGVVANRFSGSQVPPKTLFFVGFLFLGSLGSFASALFMLDKPAPDSAKKHVASISRHLCIPSGVGAWLAKKLDATTGLALIAGIAAIPISLVSSWLYIYFSNTNPGSLIHPFVAVSTLAAGFANYAIFGSRAVIDKAAAILKEYP